MIVPQYWAEARLKEKLPNRQITVRRFGWSDVSQEEAQTNADARTAEAMEHALRGENIQRREPRVAYNGAEGVPIREEILSRHGDVIVTRNGYGAQCLNTPDVLFADVDFREAAPFGGCCLFTPIVMAGAFAVGLWTATPKKAILYAMAALVIIPTLILGLHKAWVFLRGGDRKIARRRYDRFAASNPDWRMRLYETPAGLRVLVMHRTFDPTEQAVTDFFHALKVDEIYALMCRNQRCFRARVSPKPWRIGMSQHIRPRRTAWPVAAEYLPARAGWVREYESKSRDFSSCSFLSESGTGPVHPSAQAVQELHDEMGQAASGLPAA